MRPSLPTNGRAYQSVRVLTPHPARLALAERTFRPKKSFQSGTRRYELHKYARATLGSGNLKAAVQTPEGEDLNEWLAVNTVDFYNQVRCLFRALEGLV